MISGKLREHREIAAIIAAFLILGSIYSIVTPLFETPDEIQHYFHVKHIADGKGLPVVKPGSEELYAQEGGQPSLYYIIGALATFWINTDDAEELLKPNPYVTPGVASPPGNKNVILHTDRENFPYGGTTLAVHLLRVLSLLFGAATVLATYMLSLQVFPEQRALALVAAALTAFNPEFIFTNAGVNNDGLLTALCSVALPSCAFLLTKGPSLGRFVSLGVLVGLAAVTKLSGLGLSALVIFTLLILAVRHSPREAIKGGATILGLVMLLAGWWYLRNWLLYHEPTGISTFLDALAGPVGRKLPLRRIVRELHGFKLSYWAVFGWLNVLTASWVYRFFDLVMITGVIGLPLALIRALKRPRTVSFTSLLLMLLWIVVIALGYVRYNQMIRAATGRLVFPAISCFSILLSWGLIQFPPRQRARAFAGVLSAALFLVAAICPFLYIAPAYARPSPLSEQALESIPNKKDVEYGEQMGLLGHELGGKTFRPGEMVDLTLYWQALTAMERDYSVSLIVLTPNGDLIGQEDSYPGLGTFPTSFWKDGDVIADRAWVRIGPRTRTPTIGWLGVSVYYLPTMEHLTAQEGGQPIEQLFLEPIKIVPWGEREYDMSHTVRYSLGNKIDLIGHDLDKEQVHPGERLTVTLYWQAIQEMDQDYTVFTHLIDGKDRIWAQEDGQPLGGDYPTSFWDPGEVVRDGYEMNLPSDMPAGEYLVEVGFYLVSTGERLPVLDDAGEIQDNRVLLAKVSVTE